MTGSERRQRLAAILAADAAGYSRLMAADEHATVAALDAARAVFRKLIESNHGRVIDMAGDSVLAVFETAIGAVSTAMAIQDELRELITGVADDRRMRFRIGVHLGDVIEKVDGTVYGDGVNIASRLEGLAEPGGITVSESIRTAVKGKVVAAFEDQGEQIVKNIAEPVRVYRVNSGAQATPSPKIGATEIDLSLPDKPSIAVLAFANLSGDSEQEYFTDGVTEDIITELSRSRELFVIARNSSFTYKGKPVDVRTVARELGVRYVLEGSIRKAANRIRVTGQLIDAMTGNHLWAEKYDRSLEDIFEVQEELTRSIVTAIVPEINRAEHRKARDRGTLNLRAYDLGLRAIADLHDATHRFDLPLWDKALAQARQALAIDPHSVSALLAIAWAQGRYLAQVISFGTEAQARRQEGMAAAARMIELDAADSRGHAMQALMLMGAGRINEALASARRGHAINPNEVHGLVGLAHAELFDGLPNLTLEHSSQAVRMSPRQAHYMANSYRAAACFLLRDHSMGLEFGLLAIGAAPNWPVAQLNYALVAVGAGDMAGAQAALEAARRLAPEAVQRRLDGELLYRRPEDRRRLLLAWRIAAGLEDLRLAQSLR